MLSLNLVVFLDQIHLAVLHLCPPERASSFLIVDFLASDESDEPPNGENSFLS